MFSFSAIIYKEGMNYAVDLPGNSKSHFQKSGYIPVHGTIDNLKFKGTLIPRKNDSYVLFINREVRSKIKKGEFDKIEINIEHDPESRELPIPEDVELILLEESMLFDEFIKLSPAHRRELIVFINDAKRAETRLKRIQRIAEHLRKRILKAN